MWSLVTVFKVHRFIAGASGLALLLLPGHVSQVFNKRRIQPREERLVMTSWAGFILAVAGIVHAAPTFTPAAQEAVGKALATCFAIETVLYAKELKEVMKPADEPFEGHKKAVMSTGAIFVGLFVAYAGALLKK